MSSPLVPRNLDLRDFPFMPVDIRRLLTSETWLTATGDEKAAAMTLWLESWHQVPAGSLPDNDRMLSILSQAGGKWKKVRVAALRGWTKCDDGRLYHPVVCEKALEAWERKQSQRRRTAAAREARLNRDATESATEDDTENVTSSVTENVTSSKGQGQGKDRDKKEPSSLRSDVKKASRIDSNWSPSPELLEYARSQGMPEGVIGREIENFRDYWAAKPGKDGTKLDWPATFRTWIRRACERAGYAPISNGHGKPLPPKSEEDARNRLQAGRQRQQWPRSLWGPAPGEDGCLIPEHLVERTDHGWDEWKQGTSS